MPSPQGRQASACLASLLGQLPPDSQTSQWLVLEDEEALSCPSTAGWTGFSSGESSRALGPGTQSRQRRLWQAGVLEITVTGT